MIADRGLSLVQNYLSSFIILMFRQLYELNFYPTVPFCYNWKICFSLSYNN